MSSIMKRQNILQLMRDRELNDRICTKYALKNQINSKCISKLGLFAELNGHQGCVNCLQWNASGSTLASASDDFQVILWDPFLQNIKTSIQTLHRGNIFTVKFMPNYHDDVIATGAGDWNSHTYNVTTGKRLSVCSCARGRIKRIAVANDTPDVYWSASEDGCVRQYDMRMSHDCSTFDQSKNVLVSMYGDSGRMIEAKCLDINQLRTEQLAVGASDPYVRLYDRRMIHKLSSCVITNDHSKITIHIDCGSTELKENIKGSNSVVQYFVPGHLHLKEHRAKNKNIGITYLTFSPDGKELLVNYGGEYVYLYDLSNQLENAFSELPKVLKVPRENGEGSSTDVMDDPVNVSQPPLPVEVQKLKLKANYFFEKKDFTSAINIYNKAINIFESSVLFSNRAAAYIKRRWHGDFYAALKDCVTALKLEPNHMKAHFRLAICLFELGQYEDSRKYLDQFTEKYPSYRYCTTFKMLNGDLLLANRDGRFMIAEKRFFESQVGISIGYSNNRTNVAPNQKAILETYFRSEAKDYSHRYYGHCNTSTDIKEANYFGSRGQYIVAGSDDGLYFVWDKSTENNLLILKGDSSIVNCLQPHPSEFMLATSGIDNEVKLWTPLPDDLHNEFEIKHYRKTAMLNQRRMMEDPFDVVLRGIRRIVEEDIEVETLPEELAVPEQFYSCRPS